MATIPNLAANVTAEELGEALKSAGCAVVRGVLGAEVRARLEAELGPHIEAAHPEAGAAMNQVYAAEGGLGYVVTASMWALTDFTEENGGTRLVPGSHRWEAGRVARDEEVVAAEMPAGSVLFWAGGLLHGAGANRSNSVRCGLFVSFSVGWVRQEENHYLEIPVAEIHELSPEMRELIGYKMHTGLGFSEAYW